MDNKIALVYSNGEYTVNINGTLMHKGNDAEEMFEKFRDLAEQYVNVYVSLRPYSSTYFKAVDTEANASEAESVIFFIDTENVSPSKMSTSVASDTKKYRMIYVECE